MVAVGHEVNAEWKFTRERVEGEAIIAKVFLIRKILTAVTMNECLFYSIKWLS